MFISKKMSRAAWGWRRLLATTGGTVVLAAGALVAGGPAASAAVTVTPITVNTPDWSSSAGWGSAAPGYYFSQGIVHLVGAATQVQTGGPNPDLIGWLPIKPYRAVFEIVHTFGGTYADLEIWPDGEIRLFPPKSPAQADYSFVSLDSVSFNLNGATTPIGLNFTYWSIFAGYGSEQPAWSADPYGFVHLEGAARLLSLGPGSDLIGTLPPAAWPYLPVEQVVHTLAGTFADISISTSGEIRVIGPAAPGGTPGWAGYSFVSLDGISYISASSIASGQIDGCTPVELNDIYWTNPDNQSRYGSGIAGCSFLDPDRNLHMWGHVRVYAGGPGSDLIGWIKVHPAQMVYAVVSSGAGTYVDLSIDTAGEVRVIGPRAPAVADYSYVSLDGIIYST